MKLVEQQEFKRAIGRKPGTDDLSTNFLMNLFKLNELNRVYGKLSENNPVDFLSSAIQELNISYEIEPEALKNLPKDKAFIIVANHPYGGIDGILLLHLLLQIRPDFKIMGNYLLQRIQPLEQHIFPVNPFELHPEYGRSFSGIRNALLHLRSGGCMGIFPAGEVSSFNRDFNTITDKPWSNSILKFIKKAGVTIIPVYFSGTNSRFFHALGLLHPSLRTVKLPSELFNKKDKLIRIKIGNPISIDEQESFKSITQFGRYIRACTYLLESKVQVKPFFSEPLFKLAGEEKIIPAVDSKILCEEVNLLYPKFGLFTSGSISVICAPTAEMPNCMMEIGRLREITFRAVGEGTNKKIDIDEFDLYYRQLFLWDNEADCIAGAYRIGMGREIIEGFGHKGFYIHSLFKIKKSFFPVLESSIELGRSFIVSEYQKKPMSLFLLWKGILFFLLKNPEYRYLIGPVSISNRFSKLSRKLLMDFIRRNYYNVPLSQNIRPRKKYKVQNKLVDTDILIETMHGDLKKLDSTINNIEDGFSRIPVLLKKYLQLNGKILGFNLDPKFNDALDGLLLLDLYDVPQNVINSLTKEFKELDRVVSHIFPIKPN